jgi:hypothetical protein
MRRPTIALTFGRRDPADHERAVECGRQGVGDGPAGRDRISGSADDAVTVSVAMSALPRIVLQNSKIGLQQFFREKSS